MRQDGLKGQRKYRKVITTNSNHKFPVAPNVLNREFTADGPNQKWVADITYVPTDEVFIERISPVIQGCLMKASALAQRIRTLRHPHGEEPARWFLEKGFGFYCQSFRAAHS